MTGIVKSLQDIKSYKSAALLSLACGLSISFGVDAALKDFNQSLNLNLQQTTVSGLSSGGFMATQFHLSHADWVQGVGVIAAGPYFCAQNSLTTALSNCIGQPKQAIELTSLNKHVENWRSSGLLAPKEALKHDKVWILGGTQDKKVGEDVVRSLYQQYSQWIPNDQIHFAANQAFAHHFPTLSSGIDCAKSESPFIGNCGYDAAGELLSHLIPEMKAPKTAIHDHIQRIKTKVLPDNLGDTLGENAYLYVPESCANGAACRLHISFHGCNQNEQSIDLQFVEQTGYNRWAENNDLVVLYPQTKNSNMLPFNPQGCWDWWGYTDENYANRQGQQIKAIEALAKHITGN